MKGDFSRWTFDPRRHYTAVLMQQGRVQLDSDWNEQAAMLEHLDRTRFGDVVGSSGVPRGVGFEVYVGADGSPMLTAGRIYAGGLICELDADTPISHVARTPLRQWNQTAGPTVTIEPNSIALEDGIRVCFGGSGFRRGDYWTFPAVSPRRRSSGHPRRRLRVSSMGYVRSRWSRPADRAGRGCRAHEARQETLGAAGGNARRHHPEGADRDRPRRPRRSAGDPRRAPVRPRRRWRRFPRESGA